MKTILFNGCSMVTGDAFLWEKYCIDNNFHLDWFFQYDSNFEIEFKEKYKKEYRRKYNLPSIVSEKLGLQVIDLSEDGNSNDAITMSTINFLLSMPHEERKNLHVVIGWSSPYRRMVWCKGPGYYTSLHNTHIEEQYQDKSIIHLIPYVKEAIIMADIQDHFYNYVKNIMLLENFLKANSCDYTFYRSIGNSQEFRNCNLNSISHQETNKNFPKTDIYTDHNKWYKFKNTDTLPFIQNSVYTLYLSSKDYNRISDKNGHPKYEVIKDLASNISTFLRQKIV